MVELKGRDGLAERSRGGLVTAVCSRPTVALPVLVTGILSMPGGLLGAGPSPTGSHIVLHLPGAWAQGGGSRSRLQTTSDLGSGAEPFAEAGSDASPAPAGTHHPWPSARPELVLHSRPTPGLAFFTRPGVRPVPVVDKPLGLGALTPFPGPRCGRQDAPAWQSCPDGSA